MSDYRTAALFITPFYLGTCLANASSRRTSRQKGRKMGITEKMGGVKAAMAEIEKQFGRGAIMLLGGEGGTRFDEPVSVIPSGSVGVDRALGVGGLPRGRIIEIYGPEASGKTTMALHAIANAQQTGIAAFVDAEHALDPKYAEALGIDLDQLLVSQPDNGEQALEIVETLIRSNAVDLIVIDSVAALVPKAEIEGEMGDAHVGLQARLMSQAMRKLTGHTARSKTTIIFINQTRHKIGVMFGSPETTTGGNALKFYATIRLDIRRIGALKSADEVVGNRVRVKVVKNKVAPPFREAEFDVIYGRGVSIAGELIDIGIDQKLVEKSGSWYALGGVRMGQGKERAREWLEARPTLMAKLRTVVVKDGKLADLGRPDSWDEPATAPSGVTKDVTKDAAKNAA